MEWIRYHEKEKVFELRTENSTYQMQVREYDTLVHLLISAENNSEIAC